MLLGFRYWTDGAVVEPGFQVDHDRDQRHGARRRRGGRGLDVHDGFRDTTGSETPVVLQRLRGREPRLPRLRHVAEDGLQLRLPRTRSRTGSSTFPYQDGLLISYWDIVAHGQQRGRPSGRGPDPPGGRASDVPPRSDGTLLRPRILSFDSTFGSKQNTKAITVNINSVPTTIPAQAGGGRPSTTRRTTGSPTTGTAHLPITRVATSPSWNSVKVPKTGTTISIKSGGPQSAKMQVDVAPK